MELGSGNLRKIVMNEVARTEEHIIPEHLISGDVFARIDLNPCPGMVHFFG